jgi:hypothetical protein
VTGEPTPEPSETPTEKPTDEPSDEPTEQPTQSRPTLLPSERPTEPSDDPPTTATTATTTQSPTQSPTASESTSTGEEAADSADDDGLPGWVWWLLVAAVLAVGGLTWFLLARSRRRRAWQEQLEAAEIEVAWVARELLPQLRSTGSVDRVSGGWQVALPRVAAAEDQLTALESTAEDEPSRARAQGLRDAVRDARGQVAAATIGRATESWALGLDEAIATLEAALAPTPTTPPPDSLA